MKEKTDISYGVVPIYKSEEGGEWKVLLVHQISYRGPNDTFWILPKGHAEEGESPVEAARRELLEETGVKEVEIQAERSFDVTYSFTHEGVLIRKTVQYFIGVCSSTEILLTQPREIKEIGWFTFEEAKQKVTHKNTHEVLEKIEKEIL